MPCRLVQRVTMSKTWPLSSLAKIEVNALMPIAYVKNKKSVQLCWALTLLAALWSHRLFLWTLSRMLPAHNVTSNSAFSSDVVCASCKSDSKVPAKHSKFAIIWRRHFHKSLPSGIPRTLMRKMAYKHTRDSRVRGRNSTATLTGIEKEIYVFCWVSINMLNVNVFRKVVTCMESLSMRHLRERLNSMSLQQVELFLHKNMNFKASHLRS